uniref:Uncharacterized protein n=1 Tax=Spongospora subterranea TaxID=70186 RepID=A0A0H5R6J0_9EUKA|eukprot:CRZ09387.1 hypothetical protein [Spongospora subterranea]
MFPSALSFCVFAGGAFFGGAGDFFFPVRAGAVLLGFFAAGDTSSKSELSPPESLPQLLSEPANDDDSCPSSSELLAGFAIARAISGRAAARNTYTAVGIQHRSQPPSI